MAEVAADQYWWQYRLWGFVADMNFDGVITITDVWLWFKWLYFIPGDAVVSIVGPLGLGRFLEMTPDASLGGLGSGVMSFLAWTFLITILVAVYNEGTVKDN